MTLSIQSATLEDIPVVRQLEQEAFGFTWDEPTFGRELERENGVLMIARLEQRLIASAQVVWAAGEAQLNSIVVDPAYRGRGVARQFLGRILRDCQARGLAWLTLEVKWDNPPALALYRHFGFVTIGRRKHYYREGQDARLMWAGHLQSPHFKRRLA